MKILHSLRNENNEDSCDNRNITKIKIISLIVFTIFFFGMNVTEVFAGTMNIPPNFLGLNSGLVGWWTMDGKDTPWTSETAATTLDKSGNGNTGTLTNMNRATSPVAGKIGQGLKFDGVDDYVTTPYSIDLDNALTVSLWVKIADTTHNNYTFVSAITSASNYWVLLHRADKSGVTLQTQTLLFGKTTPTTNMTANTWTHVVLTKNSGTTVAIYQNGVQITNAAIVSGGFAAVSLHIGELNAANYLNGSLDDVRIYNRALSANEITQLYKTGLARINQSVDSLTDGLVGKWTFDGKDTNWGTNKTNDVSGNGNTGTMVNMSITTSPTVGKIGQGLKFDGVDDVVSLTSSSNFIPLTTSPFTVSFWFNAKTIGSSITMGIEPEGRIVNFHRGSTSGSAIAFSLYSNNKLTYFNNGDQSTNDWSQTISTNKWYFVTLSYSGTAFQKYLNGMADGVLSTKVINAGGSYPATLGSFDGTKLYFNGSLDDVRIYNRALSATEVQQLYKMGR